VGAAAKESASGSASGFGHIFASHSYAGWAKTSSPHTIVKTAGAGSLAK
jgi:hypothetical protein